MFTDWNDIDMTIVKKAIDGIVKPFQTGTFP